MYISLTFPWKLQGLFVFAKGYFSPWVYTIYSKCIKYSELHICSFYSIAGGILTCSQTRQRQTIPNPASPQRPLRWPLSFTMPPVLSTLGSSLFIISDLCGPAVFGAGPGSAEPPR